MNDNKSPKEEYYMYTDYWRAKDVIWESYSAFIEQYGIYMMYRRSFKRTNRVVRSGLIRYADYLYHEIRTFINTGFSSVFEKKDIDRINSLFSSLEDNFSDEDFLFLRNFFENFMVVSGLKKIMIAKDNRDPVSRAMSNRYQDVDFHIGDVNE